MKVSFRFAVGLTLAMHFFGFWGMLWELSRPVFVLLTPLNLLVSAYFLLEFQARGHYTNFLRFFGLAALAGYAVEVLGVQTGLIFGTYWYGQVLGWKLLEVPPLIGLNWAVLTVACGTLVQRLVNGIWLRTALTALALVLMDFLIEPVAIFFDWWTWETEAVPLQNYLAWYLTAFLLAYGFFRANFPKENPYVPFLIAAQLFFFVAHNLWV